MALAGAIPSGASQAPMPVALATASGSGSEPICTGALWTGTLRRRRSRLRPFGSPAGCGGGGAGGVTTTGLRGIALRAWSRTVISSEATCLQCWLDFANAGHEQCDRMPSGDSPIVTAYGSASDPRTFPCASVSPTLTSSTTFLRA